MERSGAAVSGDPASSGAFAAISVPRGLVSYAPAALPRHRTGARSVGSSGHRLAKAIAVTSGKGGVGKTNIAVNLAIAMVQLGRKVCLIDGDLGLANADVLCNLSPQQTLEHVVTGQRRLGEIMMLAPGGFRLVPGASGVTRMADLASRQRHELLEQLSTLERVADTIIIDTGAGISENVLALASAAHMALVTITPEPTAITDGYGIIKALSRRPGGGDIHLLVNMAAHNAEGESVFARVNRVSRAFLNRSLIHAGTVPNDGAVRDAVRQRVPFLLSAPESPAARSLRVLARRLTGVSAELPDEGKPGFFARLAAWMSGSPGFPGSPGSPSRTARENAKLAIPAKVARPISPISR